MAAGAWGNLSIYRLPMAGDPTPAMTRRTNPLRSGAFRKSPEQLQATEIVQAWTRERFTLEAEAPVLVSQLACTSCGCPPLQTVVAFWTASGDRHHFKVPKPVVA